MASWATKSTCLFVKLQGKFREAHFEIKNVLHCAVEGEASHDLIDVSESQVTVVDTVARWRDYGSERLTDSVGQLRSAAPPP